MSKPSEWGAPLPDELEPAGMVSVCIHIPDTLEYRSAFWGQLWELGNAWFWEQADKTDERRQVAAQVWRQALSTAVDGYIMGDGCGGMIEFRFTEECGLEYRNNDGDWTPVSGWTDLAPACFQGPPGADGSDGAAPEIRVYDGYIQWRLEGSVDWINLISVDDLMGDTGPQGPPGDTGLQGPPGDTGPQGPPGDCDCTGGIDETFGEDGDGKRCDIASYFVDLILPDLVEQALDFSDSAATVSGFISLALGIVAAVGGPAGLAFAAGAASILAALFALDSGLIRDELTVGFWEDVRCRLRCVIPENGVIDDDVKEDMALAVESITGSLQATTTVAGVIRAMAPGFIAQAGLLGSLYSGNCSGCESCPEDPPEDVSAEYWLSSAYLYNINYSGGAGSTENAFILPAIPGAVGLLIDSRVQSFGCVNSYAYPGNTTEGAITRWGAWGDQGSASAQIKFSFNNTCDRDLYRYYAVNHNGAALAAHFNALEFEGVEWMSRGGNNADNLAALRAGGLLQIRNAASNNNDAVGYVRVRIIVDKSITGFPGA